MKLLKYLLVAIIAFSAVSCVDEAVGPLRDGGEDTPATPPPPPPIKGS